MLPRTANSSPADRLLRVAGIQVDSRNGDPAGNLARAGHLVARAADRGAKLVLGPEFLATGYTYHPSIWRAAETRGGATETWLCEQAAAHQIYIGASYLERRDRDFHNTFALATPDGAVIGRVGKHSLPVCEGWYFRSSTESRVITTPLGRIGVGICQDTNTAAFMNEMMSSRVDLLLSPHSAPEVAATYLDKIGGAMRANLAGLTEFCSSRLGVPTIMVNKAGLREEQIPVPFLPGVAVPIRFPGLTTLCDGDGSVLAQLGAEEGMAIGDVHLGARRPSAELVPPGYWAVPIDPYPRLSGATMRALEWVGRAAYAASWRRRCFSNQ